MNEIPTELKRAIINYDLVLFVGAGLSFNLTNTNNQKLNGWKNLVVNILNELEEKGYIVNHLKSLVEFYDPIVVLDLIEKDKNLPKNEIYNFVKNFYILKEDNDFSLHKKLFELSKKIITTNYDTAFEDAVPKLRKNKAYKGRNYELTKHKDKEAILLFKLHGCSEDADSMVLFPSNYRNLYESTERDAEHSLLVLKNIILNKTILFIGVGLGDFQINNIFKEVKKLQKEFNQKHFIITNKTLDSSLDFLTPIKISGFDEINSIIDDLLIIKKEVGNNESYEIKLLKGQLDKANKKIEELKNTSNKDKLLEREALKYFSKGLKFSISNKPLKASKEYKTALELKPDLYEAYNNWGNDLGELAKTKEGKEAEDLYEKAFEKYQKAIEIKPNFHDAYNNWGINLSNLAKTKEYKKAEDLYEKAFEKYQKAIVIKPDFYEAYNNWGNDLGELAKTKEGKEAEILYEQAFEKFHKAVDIKPNYYEAFFNLGTYLGELARSKKGVEAGILYEQAFQIFQKAIEIKPDYHEAYNNWGTDLAELAKTIEGKEAEILLKQAFKKFQKAIELGGSCFNLSCLYALKKLKNEALKYLDIALSKKEIPISNILKDEDWKEYLEDEEFLKVIEKYKK